MLDKEFKTVKELLDFVLTECGGMNYSLAHQRYREMFFFTSLSEFDAANNPNPEQDVCLIFKNSTVSNDIIIFDYISYVNQFLQKYFNIGIGSLIIPYLNLTQMPDNFLKNLNKLVILDCSNNFLTELPELPKSLKLLSCWSNQLAELPELPEGLVLRCQDNPNYTKWKAQSKEYWEGLINGVRGNPKFKNINIL